MKSTIENKAKFFAQYLGQEVLFDGIGGLEFVSINSMYECFVEKRKNAWLDLTPLQDITDDDAIDVAKMLNVEFSKSWIVNSFTYSMWSHSTLNTVKATDYLRSKGYALPFIGLSVNDLVEYGWLKLKTNKDEKQ